MIIPDAVTFEDAALLPSMETGAIILYSCVTCVDPIDVFICSIALSLVQDAAPIAGDRICIMGQGIIGLLTTAILSRSHLFDITVMDPATNRLVQTNHSSSFTRSLADAITLIIADEIAH
jgi:tRNA A37 threonylcarbamoyladenosine dehydratase